MLSIFSHSSLIFSLAILHCVIGALAALIAYRKGQNFPRWLIIGLIGGTPSLIAALWLKSISFEPSRKI